MKHYDLIVAGGGMAGVSSAICAAREGLRVLLIEKEGCFGGAMSNSLVFPFMPYWTGNKAKGNYRLICGGIFEEMMKRQEEISGKEFTELEPEIFKLVLDELFSESGADVLFHAMLCKAETSGDKVKRVTVATKTGTMDFEADFFIDATGDGDLFALAGCEFLLGRPSDNLCQPMTTCFRMSGVDIEGYKREEKEIQKKYKEYKECGKISCPREDIMAFYGIGEGILHLNTTRIIRLDPTNPADVSKAEIQARHQVKELVKFFKEVSDAFKNATLISIASTIGVRESRKLKGMYVLSGDDLKNQIRFEDTVAIGNYEIDIHDPNGGGTSHYFFGDDEYYCIPYKSLVAKEYKNLLVAGRCISATHEAQAAIRIMPTCACLGQAAGIAVSVAKKDKTDTHCVSPEKLTERLLETGAVLSLQEK